MDFFVYGPGDVTCTGTPVASSLNRPMAGGSATSGTFSPSAPGTYRVIARYSGDANYNPVSGNCNDANETVVVAQATPQIITAVNDATLTLGQSFTDTATITTPAGAPAPTGTVDFFVYSPGDTTCTGTPFATSLARPVGAGGTATSGTFTPSTVGTYRVIARYNGDANYAAVSGLCNDPDEAVVVAPVTPAIVTAVNDATLTLGDTFTDTATITFPAGATAPTGTVDFTVYAPGDTTCTGAPFATSNGRPVGAGGTATSGTFTPNAVGTYRVIARYNGNANYNPVSGACNDANEQVVVALATPQIATAVNDATITLGEHVHRHRDGDRPSRWTDADRNRGLLRLRPGRHDVHRHAGGVLAEPADGRRQRDLGHLLADRAGHLPGDRALQRRCELRPVSGNCNDANETVVVAPATPQIATAVNDATITLGDTFTDTATITTPAGSPAPTGTVDFFVYGPNDATCSGTPVEVSLGRPVGAGGTATSGTFSPDAIGTYRVIARYNGDANYNPVSGLCNDANETVVVAQATPQIATAVNDATITLGQTFTDTATITVPAGAPDADGHGGLHGLRAGRHDLHGRAVRNLQRPAGERRWHGDLGHVHAQRSGDVPGHRALQRRCELQRGRRATATTPTSRSRWAWPHRRSPRRSTTRRSTWATRSRTPRR